jgi:mannose/cellobiose epimerase-like protein (N-acyl-D-glucosamine 2-epimerase family)
VLRAPAEAFRAWMTGAALPLWCSAGHAGPGLGFVDELDARAKPVPADRAAVLVQARQIYVYSHAAVLGWRHGLAAAESALGFLRAHAWRADGGGGWVRALGRGGGVADPTVELYDNAFVLLALAWFACATGDAGPIALAHRTLDAIEARMRAGSTPGYANTWPPEPGPRLQNPHMHLLEAALALHDATGGREPRFTELARALVRLFRERLFDPATGTLAELYGPAWQRLPERFPGRQIWPGHHFEWVWLLHQAEARTGEDARAEARALFAFAERHGIDGATGLVRYAVTEEGVPLDRSLRLWPQTEALKAELSMVEHEGRDPAKAARAARALLRHHLARIPRGLWTERHGEDGAAERIPAISLYHLFMAHAELSRAAGIGAAGGKPR